MIVRTSSKDGALAASPNPARLVIGTLLHTLLLPGTLIVGLPYWLLQESVETGPPAAQLLLGAVFMLLGTATIGVCFWDFVVSGKGTPNPLDPPRVLVSQRLYRYIRNPIYGAVVTVLIGEALVFGAPSLAAYAAVVWLVLQFLVVFYEEPTLRRGFGARYDAYCTEVPRWIPRWPQR